jgi:hypothetical protein
MENAKVRVALPADLGHVELDTRVTPAIFQIVAPHGGITKLNMRVFNELREALDIVADLLERLGGGD